MYIFSQLYEDVFTISLIFTEENISETLASGAKWNVFNKIYIKNISYFRLTFIYHKYFRINSRMD